MKKNATKTNKKKNVRSPPSPVRRPPPMLHAAWMKYLLLCGQANDVVRARLLDGDLPAPADDELDAMRAALTPPKGFKPTSTKHKPSLEYVEQMKLGPWVYKTAEANQALVLLRSPRPRELVEAAVVTGVPLVAVVKILAVHMNMNVTTAMLKLYVSTFFDVGTVSRSQLRVLVQQRVRQGVLRVVGGEEDAPTARRAIAADARTVAMSLSASVLGWGAVLMAMGIAPAKQDLPKLLDELGNVAAVRTAHALLRGGRDDERRAAGFAGVLQTVRRLREGAESPDDALRKQLLQFNIRHDETPLTTVNELRARGEGVTCDVVPVDHTGTTNGTLDAFNDFDADDGEPDA
jgi:hypothetical protein